MTTFRHKGHTITRTRTTTDTTRYVFGEPMRAVAYIHTVEGPMCNVGVSALIPSAAEAKRLINDAIAMEEALDLIP